MELPAFLAAMAVLAIMGAVLDWEHRRDERRWRRQREAQDAARRAAE